MADSTFLSNTPLSNRNTSGEDAIESRLPNGGCNYTNLSLGVNAAKCGCRRFWDRSLVGASLDGSGKTGFCMCEHHACFHDHTSPSERESLVVAGSGTPRQGQRMLERSTQDNDIAAQPVLGSPPQDVAFQDPVHWSRFVHGSSQGLPAIPSQCLLPSDNGSMTSGSQSGYSRPFGGQGLDTLSHIPRPGEAAPQAANPRMQIYEDRFGVQHQQSLTDVATPSVRTSQDEEVDLVKHAASVANRLETIAESQGSQTEVPLRTAAKVSTSQGQIKDSGVGKSISSCRELKLVLHEQQPREPNDLSQRIAGHDDRLDQLENISFTNPATDRLERRMEESHEMLDIRVMELENRVDIIESAQCAPNYAASFGTRQSIEGSFTSVNSSAVIVPAAGNLDSSRLETLEAQVAELQNFAPPSCSRPWELEVVFLPFGTQLHGVWSTKESMTPRSRVGSSGTGTDDWTQTQHNSMALAQACLASHDRSMNWEKSASDMAEDDTAWLMAKACGVSSRVDNRLRSRGLVRTIQICGPDARDVQSAMVKEFGDLLNTIAEDPFASQDENLGEVPRNLRNYIGLQATWIPLRKMHKDTCLRFLNPAEMVTPALWTVPFLSSSVAMRQAGTRRLYVTQRDSYIQHHSDSGADWTWQKLRQLPRVYSKTHSFSHTPEADAQEECWAFDARLDPPPSVHASLHSSFASQYSQLSITSPPTSPNAQHPDHEYERDPVSPSDHFSSAAASPTTSTPRTSIPPQPTTHTSPLRQRNPFRPIHHRTISMSSLIPIRGDGASQTQNPAAPTTKRRITSFDLERDQNPHETSSHSSPIPAAIEPILTKRRRISRSPSRPRNTPRWSSAGASPSPFFHINNNDRRSTTPFAYATPHSNAPRSGVGIDVYEDGSDGDLDYEFRNEDDAEAREDSGSLTDANEDVGISGQDFEEDDDEEGYERNALSDFGGWDGAGNHDDNILTSATLLSRPSNHQEHEQDGQQQDQEEEGDDGEDGDSVTSDSPSEYPSTQLQLQRLQQQQQQKGLVDHEALGLLYERRRLNQREARGEGRGDGREFRIHVDEE